MDYRTIAKRRKVWTIISIFAIFIILFIGIWRNNNIVQPTLQKPIYITDTVKIERFSEANLIKYMNILDIEYANIVLNQAKHETGNFTSNRFKEYNALFGFQISDVNIIKYKSWKESVIHYKYWQMKKLRLNEDYYNFLERVNYSEDPDYINKLKQY